MKKNIGILTYQNTLNYGAMLQAYALFKYIYDSGGNCEIINYYNEKIESDEYKYTKINFSSIKELGLSILLKKTTCSKKEKFLKFYTNKIKSSKLYNLSNISELNDVYDKIIVGSDQVWNMDLNGEDYTYLLNFINDNSKKCTYAASFGYSKIPQKYYVKTIEYLKSFNNLYVREETGKEIIEKNSDRNAEVTVDPTFLLNKDEWLTVIDDRNNKIGKYILLYMVDISKYKNDIYEFAKKNNCKIISVSNSLKDISKMHYIRDASPDEFLNLINNSYCVFTGSFHAVSLSINLHKDFYYISNKNGRSSRITNILKIANLESRELSGNEFKFEKINYNNIKNNLNDEILKSKELLNKIIKGK